MSMTVEDLKMLGRKYRVMYVGRFQIFHNGHLNIAKYIDSRPDTGEIVAIVGSSQYSRYKKNPEIPWILNPFTGEERKCMLEMSLEGVLTKPFRVVPIEDTHNCPKWFESIDGSVIPEIFYTNEPKEIKLFESYGIPTREIPKQEGGFHAQVIREMIANGDNYRNYIPTGTTRFIDRFGMEDILRDFYNQHPEEIEIVHQMQVRDGITPYDANMKY